MDAQLALTRFLREVLATKRDRLCGFASKAKTRRKFLYALYHDLGTYVTNSSIVSELPSRAWQTAAFAFTTPDQFGTMHDSLAAAYDAHEYGDGALLITADSRFGIYCDHTYVDAQLFLAAKSK